MNRIPSPRLFKPTSMLSTSTRVEASSMLIISSAMRSLTSSSKRPSDQEALLLAAGELVGELVEDISGVERHRFERRSDLVVPVLSGEVRESTPGGTSRTPGLPCTSGLYELKGSWKTPWTWR